MTKPKRTKPAAKPNPYHDIHRACGKIFMAENAVRLKAEDRLRQIAEIIEAKQNYKPGAAYWFNDTIDKILKLAKGGKP